MSNEETMDTLDIADLEQDIGGAHAVEAGESHINGEGFIAIMFYQAK